MQNKGIILGMFMKNWLKVLSNPRAEVKIRVAYKKKLYKW